VKNFERTQEDQYSTTLVQKQEHVDPFIQDIDFEDNPYDHELDSDVYTANERNDYDRPRTPVDQGWDPDESYQTRFWNRIMDETTTRGSFVNRTAETGAKHREATNCAN